VLPDMFHPLVFVGKQALRTWTELSDLWWTKWHWDRLLSEYVGLPLPLSFHEYAIFTFHLPKPKPYNLRNWQRP
jgi:hypothetical protein